MKFSVIAAAALLAAGLALVAAPAQPAFAQSAPGGPGASATWDEPGITGFAGSLSASSKVWYTIGNGELENAFYPQTDTPDTFGLQYAVTDGATFTALETTGTTHVTKLLSNSSLVWQQVNTAGNGDFTITKTYVADPSRSVIDIATTFNNTSGKPLSLYADYHPQLDNDGMGNSGGTDTASGDLESVNGSVASALASSAAFTQTSSGYVGTSSDPETMLTTSFGLTSSFSMAGPGHIDQVARIPVAASGSTTFTMALAFDTTEAAAISDASASLSSGFSASETAFEQGWQSWLAGLNGPPASVAGSSSLQTQYYVSLMELKADEDKNFPGAFIAAPNVPWGASVSADGGTGQSGAHGYHAVWTRDEYEMATALLAAGDRTDAQAALSYIFQYEMQSSGAVKQNTWLNGTAVFGSLQMDEVADPIILAWQLGDTSAWSQVALLANYLVSNGPATPEERWEEAGGYSPATMAAEVAGLLCAASIAQANGATSQAITYQNTALSWASQADSHTYTTTGPYGSGYFLRITPDGQPNSGASLGIANGGGSHDDRTVVDPGFLELVRLGVKAASAADIASTIGVVDSQVKVSTPEGPVWHRYSFDGYGETSSGGDYTGAGVGNPWPVLSGERGEYDVAGGNLTAAQSMLATMAGAANSGFQISEQVWGASSGVNGFTFGQADNSSTPLMWAMAQFVRLAVDISAGHDVDTPSVVSNCVLGTACPVSGSVKEKVTVIVPVNTEASGQTVYLAGNLSALGLGQADWAANGIPMTRVNADEWTTTISAASGTTLSYKYDLGGSWNNAEETATCGFVSNRSMPVNGGTENDTVANWQGPGACGSSGAVISVTVPSDTPSGDTVYLSGSYSVLGTGIPSWADWVAADYPMIQTGPFTWTLTVTGVPVANFQYKFTLGSWSNVEETGSCGYVSNRTFGFTTADASYPASDTVAAWQGFGGC